MDNAPYPCMDLHVHSCHSDGTCTPAEIAALAWQAGLRAVALTDHDTVSGLAEFQEAARKVPEVECINGVELSTLYGSRELHVVGLFLRPDCEELAVYLEAMRLERRRRNEQIARKLQSLGYRLDLDALPGGSDSAGRPHIAAYLVRHYHLKDNREAFDKLLKKGAPAFVQRNLPPVSDAVDVIHKAGGVAVWAHPVAGCQERAWSARMMKKLRPFGLDAVEAYYSTFTPPVTEMILAQAETAGLACSGGSDFHGGNSPHLQIGSGGGGLRVPLALLTELKKRRDLLREPPF